VLGALVSVVVLDRQILELDRIGPGADRIEEAIPSSASARRRAAAIPADPAPITATSTSDASPIIARSPSTASA
jgi:hypothetical protein